MSETMTMTKADPTESTSSNASVSDTNTEKDDFSKEKNQTPMDSIIGLIDSYIKDPKLVTTQTLSELKDKLIDLRSFLDSDSPNDSSDMNPENQDKSGGKDGLAILIGKAAGKNGGYNA